MLAPSLLLDLDRIADFDLLDEYKKRIEKNKEVCELKKESEKIHSLLTNNEIISKLRYKLEKHKQHKQCLLELRKMVHDAETLSQVDTALLEIFVKSFQT